jgi:hypothetical protein
MYEQQAQVHELGPEPGRELQAPEPEPEPQPQPQPEPELEPKARTVLDIDPNGPLATALHPDKGIERHRIADARSSDSSDDSSHFTDALPEDMTPSDPSLSELIE